MLANLKHPQNTLSAFGHFGQHLVIFGNIWPFWAKFGQKKSQHIAVLGLGFGLIKLFPQIFCFYNLILFIFKFFL